MSANPPGPLADLLRRPLLLLEHEPVDVGPRRCCLAQDLPLLAGTAAVQLIVQGPRPLATLLDVATLTALACSAFALARLESTALDTPPEPVATAQRGHANH